MVNRNNHFAAGWSASTWFRCLHQQVEYFDFTHGRWQSLPEDFARLPCNLEKMCIKAGRNVKKSVDTYTHIKPGAFMMSCTPRKVNLHWSYGEGCNLKMPADLTLGKLLPFKKEGSTGSCHANGRECPMWHNACTSINFRDASLGIRWMWMQISWCRNTRQCQHVRSRVFRCFQSFCCCAWRHCAAASRLGPKVRDLEFFPVGNAIHRRCPQEISVVADEVVICGGHQGARVPLT